VVFSDGLVREETNFLGYKPRAQFLPFHLRAQRWAVIVAHRRAGKTVACVADLIDSAVSCERERPRFAYVAPLYKQAKTVAWDYCKSYGLRYPGATASESELRVDFPNGGQVRLYGADNPDALRGMYLDGVILDEAADMSPRVFSEVLRPTLADRKGWCVWIGTPKGQNDFYDLVYGAKGSDFKGAIADKEWFFQVLKASDTIEYYKQHPEEWEEGMLTQDELDSARRSGMSPEQYAQEFECSFQAAILGAYYGRELEDAEKEGRIGANIYDHTLQVHTAWDLGHSDSTAIWFYQQSGFEIRVIDFYAASNVGLDHYVSMLQERAARPGSDKGYKYGRHFLPHDVKVRELSTGKDRVSSLRAMGLDNISIVAKLGIDDGINAVRKILPRCWFERDKCQDGLRALRQYRREYSEERKVFFEKPHHDWASDPADAFRYLAVGLREPTSRTLTRKPDPPKKWIY
jgi:phage terminase large subunit